MKDITACPVCNHGSFSEVFPNSYSGTLEQAASYFLTDRQKSVHGRIVECQHCGFVLTSPQYEAGQYDQIYRAVGERQIPPGRTRAVAARFVRLTRRVRTSVAKGRFLDFGCGDGQFLDHMKEFDGTGLELRPGGGASQHGNDPRIILGDLETAVATNVLALTSFDFITTWDVLEHLPMLVRDVQILRGLLKPRGYFFCTVPNVASLAARISGEYWNCYLLEHLWYFSPKTLTRFFEQQGFVRHEVSSFLFPADIGTLTSRIGQTYGVTLPVPQSMRDWTLPLPAGVMFGVFQLKS